MTRRRLLLVLGIGAALALLVGLPFILASKSALEAKYDLVQPGMTTQQVEAIMGPSPYPSSEMTLMWDDGWNTAQVEFDRDGRACRKEIFGRIDGSCLGGVRRFFQPKR